MRLRVGMTKRLEYLGVAYYAGEIFEVPDDKAAAFLLTGLVLPAEGESWPEGMRSYTDLPDAE